MFTGSLVAIVTPMFEDGSIDYDSYRHLIEWHIAQGTQGIVAVGTTGESPTVSVQEHCELIKVAVQTAKQRIPIIAGAGGNSTREAVELTEYAKSVGADACLSVVPYYNKPTQEGIFRHYMAIAETSPLPLILYNVPARTGISMSAETTLRLANASSKIIATKEASGNFADICRILRDKPQGFSLISGDDALIVPTISLGGEGVISVLGNLLPSTVSELTHTALKGNFTIAAALQLRIQRIIDLLFIEGNPAGVKAAMHIRNLVQNQLRLPLVPVSQTTYDAIAAELMKFEKA